MSSTKNDNVVPLLDKDMMSRLLFKAFETDIFKHNSDLYEKNVDKKCNPDF